VARNNLVFDAVHKAGAKRVVTMGGGYPTYLAPDSHSYKNVIQAHVKDCIPVREPA